MRTYCFPINNRGIYVIALSMFFGLFRSLSQADDYSIGSFIRSQWIKSGTSGSIVVNPGEIWQIISISNGTLNIDSNPVLLSGMPAAPLCMSGQRISIPAGAAVFANCFNAEPVVARAGYDALASNLSALTNQVADLSRRLSNAQVEWFNNYGTNMQVALTNVSFAIVRAAVETSYEGRFQKLEAENGELRKKVEDLEAANKVLTEQLSQLNVKH